MLLELMEEMLSQKKIEEMDSRRLEWKALWKKGCGTNCKEIGSVIHHCDATLGIDWKCFVFVLLFLFHDCGLLCGCGCDCDRDHDHGQWEKVNDHDFHCDHDHDHVQWEKVNAHECVQKKMKSDFHCDHDRVQWEKVNAHDCDQKKMMSDFHCDHDCGDHDHEYGQREEDEEQEESGPGGRNDDVDGDDVWRL